MPANLANADADDGAVKGDIDMDVDEEDVMEDCSWCILAAIGLLLALLLFLLFVTELLLLLLFDTGLLLLIVDVDIDLLVKDLVDVDVDTVDAVIGTHLVLVNVCCLLDADDAVFGRTETVVLVAGEEEDEDVEETEVFELLLEALLVICELIDDLERLLDVTELTFDWVDDDVAWVEIVIDAVDEDDDVTDCVLDTFKVTLEDAPWLCFGVDCGWLTVFVAVEIVANFLESLLLLLLSILPVTGEDDCNLVGGELITIRYKSGINSFCGWKKVSKSKLL